MKQTEGGSVGLKDEDTAVADDARLARMKRVPQVRIVRRALGLTQEDFAERFNIPLGTLRDWEQGRKEPDQAARNYLRVIATDADAVQFALGALPQRVRGEVYKDPSHYGVERVWFVYREPKDTSVWGSVVLNAYNKTVQDFRSVLSERRAQINSNQKLPDRPGQALYRARVGMMSAYKDGRRSFASALRPR